MNKFFNAYPFLDKVNISFSTRLDGTIYGGFDKDYNKNIS